MLKTIGVLAHVDAGKTTFTEQLLYHTNTIKQKGRVDHQDAFMDSHSIEKSRGITVFADQAMMTYDDSTYTIIDTPGHVDFSPEMERSIQVMDYAIIIVSAVDGVEGHTETVWQLLRKYNIPTFFFINKTDQEGTDVEAILEEIGLDLTNDIFDLTTSFQNGIMDESLIEFIAERDENLLEQYFESGYDKESWLLKLKTLIHESKFFPCMSGSALHDIGIVDFLNKLHALTETSYHEAEADDFAARVYKIRHDENGNRVAFLKALRGKLSVRDEIAYGDKIEKVTQVRMYNGNAFTQVTEASAGQLFAVTGLKDVEVGDGLGKLEEKQVFELIPTLKSKVIFDSSIHVREVLRFFQQLDAEDPALRVLWDEHFQEIYVHVMGVIQLEILEKVMEERFQILVSFGDPKILYKETIENTVVGYGHFEPLKHYAEVHLKIEPATRNSGIAFANECHANDLSVGNQNLVKRHLFEQDHHGLLTGSPLTDIKVTLLTGRGHHEYTSGGDFREATFRALRQGLEKATNILLEPYYDFKIKVDVDKMGRILSDIQQASGSFNPPETIDDKVIITGKVPVATFMNYSTDFASYTQGKGTIQLLYGGYDLCHNEQDVIERLNYDKDADPEYTSSSIFCSGGVGHTIPWAEAEKMMHCLS